MPTEIGNFGQIYDTTSGRVVGFLDKSGRTNFIPAFFDAMSATEQAEVLSRPATDLVRQALLRFSSGGALSSFNYSTPATGYVYAMRGNQVNAGNPIDQTSNSRVITRKFVPSAWVANTAVAAGAYVSPTVERNVIFRCTTAGTTAATEGTWNETIGGTTTQGTAVFTAEQGYYYLNPTDGSRYLQSVDSVQLGSSRLGSFEVPGTDTYDIASGKSLILRIAVRQPQDYQTMYPAAAADSFALYTTRQLTGANKGISLVAYGNANNSALRLTVRGASDAATTLSGQVLGGSGKRQVDGGYHDVVLMIDGPLKMAYLFDNAVAYNGADMASAPNPHNMNLAAIAGSTAGPTRIIGGGVNSTEATSNARFAFRAVDEIIISGSLPSNIQAIAAWWRDRPDALLPQSMLQQ